MAAGGYDGSIKIVTEVVTDGFKMGKKHLESGLAQIKKSAQGTAAAMQGIGASSNKAFETARLKARETEIAIDSVKRKMEETAAASKSVDHNSSKAFQTVKIKAEASRKALAELNAQRDMMAEKRVAELVPPGTDPSRLSDSFIDKSLSRDAGIKGIDKQIAATERKLTNYKSKMEEAKAISNGVTGTASKEYTVLEKKLDALNTKLAQYKMRMAEAKKSTSGLSGITNKAAEAFKKTSSSAKDAGNSVGGTGKMIKGMLLSMLLFAAVAVAMRAISEGMQNIAQGSASANAVLSQLSTNFLYLKNSIASALMPVLQALAPMIIYIANALASLFTMIGMVTSRIFGGATTFTKAKKANVDYAASLGKTGGAAKQAAKDAKKAMASFDELNILSSTETAGGGGGGGGMPSVGDMFEEVAIPAETLAFADRLSSLFEKLKETAQPTVDELKRLGTALIPLKEFAWQALKDFYEGFLAPVGGWLLGEGLPRFIDAISNGLGKINWEPINKGLRSIWDELAPFAIHVGEGLLWLWETVLVPLGVWRVNNVLPIFLSFVASSLKLLDDAISVIMPAMAWLFSNFLKPLAEWTGGIIIDILSYIAGGFAKLADGGLAGSDAFTALKDAIIAVGSALKHVFDTIIMPIFDGIVIIIKELWNNHLQPLLVSIGGFVEQLIALAGAIISNVLGPVVNALVNIFGPTFVTVFKGIVSIVTGFAGSLFGVIKGIIDTLASVISFLKNVFTGNWKGAWGDIKNILKSVVDSMPGIIKGPINLIIGLINSMLRAISSGLNWIIGKANSISFKVPEWVPKIGGAEFGVKMKPVGSFQIPKLATGAVIPPNAEFMAILGDQKSGRNIEAPESLIRKIVREESIGSDLINEIRALGEILRSGSVMVVDGKVLAKVVNKEQSNSFKVAGKTLIPV